jgi:hypothetical protein
MFRINKVISSFFVIMLTANFLFACNSQNLNMPVFDLNGQENIQALGTENSTEPLAAPDYTDAQFSSEGNTIETFIISSERRIFNEYDLNKSGNIEFSELAEAPNSFKALDKDKNNRLTFDEVMFSPERIKQMSGWIAAFYKGLFKRVDSDGNGKVTDSELSGSEDMAPFNGLGFFNYSVKAITATKTTKKSMNQSQFNVMMNNLFINLQKKYSGYRNAPFSVSNGKLPVMLVQGYAEPSWYFMYGIYHDLKENGWQAVYPVNLFPNITDIKEQAAIIGRKIDEVKKEQGVSRVDYVCHSMGGLIGRYYIQNMDGARSIQNYVSIATPHYGTTIAWAGLGEGAKQMRPGSEFLSNLNAGNPIYPNIKYTSIWTKTDELVVPAESALLRGSIIMDDIKYTGHLLVLWAPETYKQVRESLVF